MVAASHKLCIRVSRFDALALQQLVERAQTRAELRIEKNQSTQFQ
jgi:hypothetical protein